MQDYAGAPIRVFVVDDHDIVRQGLREMFSRHRDMYVSGTSGSVEHACRVIPQLTIDVLVADLQLQDGTGIDVCREVRASNPTVGALLLTSATEDEALRAALLAGAAGYVVKLARSDHIVDAVRRVARGKTLLEPPLVERATELLRTELQQLDPPVTDRQAELMSHVLCGATNTEIADRTSVDPQTIRLELSETIGRLTLVRCPRRRGTGLRRSRAAARRLLARARTAA